MTVKKYAHFHIMRLSFFSFFFSSYLTYTLLLWKISMLKQGELNNMQFTNKSTMKENNNENQNIQTEVNTTHLLP